MLEMELEYAKAGFPVLPLHTPMKNGGCSCGKKDCSGIGKHPRTKNGVKDATTDAVTIKEMWKKWPNANIGIACGDRRIDRHAAGDGANSASKP